MRKEKNQMKNPLQMFLNLFKKKTNEAKSISANTENYKESKLSEPVILMPMHQGFQDELETKTKEFSNMQLVEALRDLNASLNELKKEQKEMKEVLVFLATSHEELLFNLFEETNEVLQLPSGNQET